MRLRSKLEKTLLGASSSPLDLHVNGFRDVVPDFAKVLGNLALFVGLPLMGRRVVLIGCATLVTAIFPIGRSHFTNLLLKYAQRCAQVIVQ